MLEWVSGFLIVGVVVGATAIGTLTALAFWFINQG
jgi:hypothetical protein